MSDVIPRQSSDHANPCGDRASSAGRRVRFGDTFAALAGGDPVDSIAVGTGARRAARDGRVRKQAPLTLAAAPSYNRSLAGRRARPDASSVISPDCFAS